MKKPIRVAVSPLSNTIYAGTLLKDKPIWSSNKADVTTDCLVAVAQHVLAFGMPVIITSNGKPEFKITVENLLPDCNLKTSSLNENI
jgi:hypothetical protein